MLIAADGRYAGLWSGGCLEGDLREHAASVIATGVPRVVSYDLRGEDDLLWGLGLGCEGAMRILLLRSGPVNAWQPLAHFSESLEVHRATAAAVVVESATQELPSGTVILSQLAGAAAADSPLQAALAASARDRRVAWHDSSSPRARLFLIPLTLPPRVLLFGAGPDALPVVEFAARLGWKVTVVDHRAAYAQPSHFAAAERVMHSRAEDVPDVLELSGYDAAVVMSHHLPSDLEYLKVLAASTIPYVGLLGPAIRREKLLADLGDRATALRARLHAPVGLALGGRSPESIALAIVAEIHAVLHGADGRAFAQSAARPSS